MQFVEYLNSYHPTIKFKCQKDVNFSFTTKKVDFLDTTIWIDDEGFIPTCIQGLLKNVIKANPSTYIILLIVINGMLLCYKKTVIAAEQHAALPIERGG